MLEYFTARRDGGHIPITLLNAETLATWRGSSAALAGQLDHINFAGRPGENAVLRNANGAVEHVLFGVNQPLKFYDTAGLPAILAKAMPGKVLESVSFSFTNTLSAEEQASAYAAWALGSDQIKRDKAGKSQTLPVLAVDMDGGYQMGESMINAINLLRELVNTPANLLGPEELGAAALQVAKDIKATSHRIIVDDELLKQNFPLIYTVGMGSPRRPRLVEFTWGDEKHPLLTIIGKGVCFDTGGINLKPSDLVKQYKRDMGGAAHALALSKLVAEAKLPVRMRVIIPIAENSIDGNAYRPGDVYPSRRGFTVEIGNTDAEGRLLLADSLTYATEKEKPDLLIDMGTLTAAVRVALGPEIVALFSNKSETAQQIERIGLVNDDPLWHLPLWSGYRDDLVSDCADLSSTGVKAGTITAALFLQVFAGSDTDWVHLDMYSWNDTPRPGRPKSAMETGLRTMFIYLQERYGK